MTGPTLQPVATAIFVIADLHFGDNGVCGERRRPFRDAEEMGGAIIERWNKTVRPSDTVFVLGDVGKRHHARAVRHLNGRKHLVAGNGDDLTSITRMDLFASVSVARWLPGFLLTHIPVHPSQLRGRTINVHGHLHSATVGNPHYRCVSVEQTDYTPVPLHGANASSRSQ